MKQYLLILSFLICLLTNAQSLKKMAVMEPMCRDNSVGTFYMTVIRGAIESVVSATDEYEAYDRSAFDQIVQELHFQRSGVVSDSEIKRMGELAGVDFILVSELMASDGYMSVIVKVLNVETGKYEGAKDGLMLMDDIPVLRNKTKQLVSLLFGIVDIESGLRRGELLLDKGKYVGEILNGKPHGKGKISYVSTDEFDRVSYEGDWLDGNRTGQGTMIWKSGEKYVGGWNNGNRNGYGIDYYANGNRYEGNFKDDKRNGKGKISYASTDEFNRVSYEGDWLDGNRTGQGTMIWKSGEKYVGGWNNGNRNGYGIDYYANGNRYEGNFKDDKRDGKGTYYFKNGNRYEGGWENDDKSGYGTFYWSSGRRSGYWKNDKENGEFTIYWNVGDKETGNFKNGKRDGDWIRITSDGKRRKAKFSEGVLVRDWHI